MARKLPKLAIVGRPNVGKSALFNRLCSHRTSIVDEAEGVTRDRIYATGDFFGKPFQLIDTGGIDSTSELPFQELIRRQAEVAIEEADALVLVVDARIGITELDRRVAQLLHRAGKAVTLAVNKVDALEQMEAIHEFHGLGFPHIIGVSAVHGLNVAELLGAAFREVVWEEMEEVIQPGIRVAVIGRPNVGKSTLVNHLLAEERCIVSPVPGTTRDSIDVDVEVDGVLYHFIDTAGIRRKRAEHDVVDKFAAIRTKEAIERADVCLMVLDSEEGLTTQEKRIAHEIEMLGKGCIVLFNKWDLIKDFRMEHCLRAARQQAPFLGHCPALFISAKTGRGLDKIYGYVQEVAAACKQRISTGELNRFLEKAMQSYHPPMLKGRRLRIYYVAQVDVGPPRFVLFVNQPELMEGSYQKYLVNQFRKTFGFTGAPLLFSLRGKPKREAV